MAKGTQFQWYGLFEVINFFVKAKTIQLDQFIAFSQIGTVFLQHFIC